MNDTTATTLNESKEVVEAGEDVNAASTPITDSNKKPKKEKSKKRFLSFRSFSFSKKDKQKPAKKGSADESAANTTAVTNGECEKVPEEVSAINCIIVYEQKLNIIYYYFYYALVLRSLLVYSIRIIYE